jgi:hypothetical protein
LGWVAPWRRRQKGDPPPPPGSGLRRPSADCRHTRTEQNRTGEGRGGDPPGTSWKKGESACLAQLRRPPPPPPPGRRAAAHNLRWTQSAAAAPDRPWGLRPPVAQRYAFGLPSPRRSRCHSLCETSSERDGVRVLARPPPKISALRTERQTQTQTPRRGERRSQEVNCQQY